MVCLLRCWVSGGLLFGEKAIHKIGHKAKFCSSFSVMIVVFGRKKQPFMLGFQHQAVIGMSREVNQYTYGRKHHQSSRREGVKRRDGN